MLEQLVNKIKNTKTDDKIRKALCEIFMLIQMDSKVRKEFDDCINEIW